MNCCYMYIYWYMNSFYLCIYWYMNSCYLCTLWYMNSCYLCTLWYMNSCYRCTYTDTWTAVTCAQSWWLSSCWTDGAGSPGFRVHKFTTFSSIWYFQDDLVIRNFDDTWKIKLEYKLPSLGFNGKLSQFVIIKNLGLEFFWYIFLYNMFFGWTSEPYLYPLVSGRVYGGRGFWNLPVSSVQWPRLQRQLLLNPTCILWSVAALWRPLLLNPTCIRWSVAASTAAVASSSRRILDFLKIYPNKFLFCGNGQLCSIFCRVIFQQLYMLMIIF